MVYKEMAGVTLEPDGSAAIIFKYSERGEMGQRASKDVTLF